MEKGRSWNLQEGRAWNIYKIPWNPTLKRNMRKNMKVPRKKENLEQQNLTNYYTENHKTTNMI